MIFNDFLSKIPLFALLLAGSGAGLFGQTGAGSLTGTVVDTSGAAVADADVTLVNTRMGTARSTNTDSRGVYWFRNIEADTYTVRVSAATVGFRMAELTGIVVPAQQIHNGGTTILQHGATTQTDTTQAKLQLQLSDTAELRTIDRDTLEAITQKGRDLFGYVRLVPGAIDTKYSRDLPEPESLDGVAVNGGTSNISVTVDGLTDLNTATNRAVNFEPNPDAVQEIGVLAGHYQAEYAGNGGAQIAVITKHGTEDIHGTVSWNHRGTAFNANSWENKHTLTSDSTAQPRAPYRFNVETYSVGGPVYKPENSHIKVFFFLSQEFTNHYVPAPTQFTYMPTSLERTGDFSQTYNNVNGNPVATHILDPKNGNLPFSGNVVPSSRQSAIGTGLLGLFPTANYTPSQPGQQYIVNYFEQGSDKFSRRDDVLRLDASLTAKIAANFRWLNDKNGLTSPFDGVQFNQVSGSSALTKAMSPIVHGFPGHGFRLTALAQLSPDMDNEVTLGRSWNRSLYSTTDNYASESRNLESNLPTLFPVQVPTNGDQSLLPTLVFGGTGLPASATYLRNGASAGEAEERGSTWTLQDNLSRIAGRHALKAGINAERTIRLHTGDQNYNGAYNFAADASVPFLNTNDGYVNALLGDVNTYSQYTAATTSNILYTNLELYLQDNWKVTRRLTLDLGIRLYHRTAPTDSDGTFVNFVPEDYIRSAMSRLYYPYCSNSPGTCTATANGLVARDPVSGYTTYGGYIGDIIPGSGNPATGMVSLGSSTAPYKQPGLEYGPRAGFAWDVFGDGKTALRGGWGLYRNRIPTNTLDGLSGQAPQSFAQTVTGVTFDQILALKSTTVPRANSVSMAPVSPFSWPSDAPSQGVRNASLNLQHLLGRNALVDVGYTSSYSYHQYLTYDLNYIPIGTSWPFTASNLNPTTAGNTSADIGSIYERSAFPGYGAVTRAGFFGSSNYNALTARATRQLDRGIALSAAYTFSKANGVTTYSPEVADNRSYNYGRLANDRKHNLQIGYVYTIPYVSRKLGFNRLGLITDRWQLSGITSFQSGAPFNPTCSVTAGQSGPASYTGTPDLAARCNVISTAAATATGAAYFNAAGFALPALGTGPNNSIVGSPVLGNLGGGAGVLTLPHVVNSDITLTKSFPLLGSERRILNLQVQAYNVFNHTEISGINTAIQFNPTTNQVSNTASVGLVNAALPNRVIGFSARLLF